MIESRIVKEQGHVERVSADQLIRRCESFMEGTKKLYETSGGDMWFFELFHHLDDCRAALAKAKDAP